MGDVADILGAQKGQVQTEEEKLISTITTATKASKPTKGPKKKGIPRELMNLIGMSNECSGHQLLRVMCQDHA